MFLVVVISVSLKSLCDYFEMFVTVILVLVQSKYFCAFAIVVTKKNFPVQFILLLRYYGCSSFVTVFARM